MNSTGGPPSSNLEKDRRALHGLVARPSTTTSVAEVVLADQIESLDWKARRAKSICRLPASVVNEALEAVGEILDPTQAWSRQADLMQFKIFVSHDSTDHRFAVIVKEADRKARL